MAAWMIETGSKATLIAVVDTGVDYTIPDMKNNVWTNQAELNGKPGVDDDNNGGIDDIHGCNFSVSPPSGDPMDDMGHGTHVAGTIGSQGNNSLGVVGVNWETSIVAVKFLNSDGSGSLADAVRGIDYATKVGVRLMSNSWGGSSADQALGEAIGRAKDAGILFVAAAGNDGTDNDSEPEYPANYPLDNIIAVAAVDAAGRLADFSCYGRKSVHVAAPGVSVLSNVPEAIDPSGFKTWSGTSMATPHVSGVAGLLFSHNPSLTYTQVKNAIVSSARSYPSLKGKTISGGMVDALGALKAIQ